MKTFPDLFIRSVQIKTGRETSVLHYLNNSLRSNESLDLLPVAIKPKTNNQEKMYNQLELKQTQNNNSNASANLFPISLQIIKQYNKIRKPNKPSNTPKSLQKQSARPLLVNSETSNQMKPDTIAQRRKTGRRRGT